MAKKKEYCLKRKKSVNYVTVPYTKDTKLEDRNRKKITISELTSYFSSRELVVSLHTRRPQSLRPLHLYNFPFPGKTKVVHNHSKKNSSYGSYLPRLGKQPSCGLKFTSYLLSSNRAHCC